MAIHLNPSLSLETILGHVVYVYNQVGTVPGGWVIGSVARTGEIESIPLLPRCPYESACPRNDGDFFRSATAHGLSKADDAFPWYCRARIRHSCSAFIAGFVRDGVPQLKRSAKSPKHIRRPVHYRSKPCQVLHWKSHKAACMQE